MERRIAKRMSLGNWSPVRSRCRRSRFFQVWMTCERSNASATTTAADGFNLSPAFGTAFPRIVPRFGESFLAVPDARTPMVDLMQIHILGDTPRSREGLPKSRDQASVLLARDLVTCRKASMHSQPSGTARHMGPTSLREAMPCRLAQPLSAGPHSKEGRKLN